MTLAEYHRGYRERLGRLWTTPLDMVAFFDWLAWTRNWPATSVRWGNAQPNTGNDKA